MTGLTGRLVMHEGRLYIDDGDGGVGQEVAQDPESGEFVAVGPDEPSHNERHGKREIEVGSGTSGPLFDGDGKQVTPGDPHHLEPLPDDAHYDPAAPGKTRLQFDPDGVAVTATSHTEAWS